MKSLTTTLISLCFICLVTFGANATLTESGEDAPIATGENVLAAGAFNDASGSSDLTLIVQLKADGDILVDEGSECKVIQPMENIPDDDDPTGWTQPKFDDSDWQDGEYGVGYGDGDDNTVIGDGQHATVYTRTIFEVKSAGGIGTLELGVDFDDATVIWINGVEVARESGTDIPELPEWDSWSDQGSGHSHEASKTDPPQYEIVELPFKVVSSPFSIEPAEKLATTWSRIKNALGRSYK